MGTQIAKLLKSKPPPNPGSLAVVFLLALASCSGQKDLTFTRAGVPTGAEATSVSPPIAKPSEVVTVSGKDFLAGKAYRAVFELDDGSTKEAC
jgi:hypothetical protein